MQNQYEAPELTFVGQAEDVVMGLGDPGDDLGEEMFPDFEFLQD